MGLRGELHADIDATLERLVVDAMNVRVVYRIGRHLPDLDCYEVEFPDWAPLRGQLTTRDPLHG
jgi:hypothetical protein